MSPSTGLSRRMAWASAYITRLQGGETVRFRARGSAMSPDFEAGAVCTVAPVDPALVVEGDIVLCKVGGSEYLHLVAARDGDRYRIGNRKGRINGWIGPELIYGRLVHVAP